ncbi:hypothetical protein TGAM01_v206449 [Trichoderma gamsii]|uniref:Uncharacterized protein n=1 Tax=Trichoderma gamsii TaxID=398673 RepID=A0A2P4ZJN9_9HYPO|nr:hypothetical protein TGAM01_v206449 [Trichoderma gamsii]PON24519.1 hypothetical protein TGAM01_v206449 [Trichoderma gamsii]
MASQSELEPLSPNDYGIRRPLQSQFSQGSSSVGANSWSFWRRHPKKTAQLQQNDGNGNYKLKSRSAKKSNRGYSLGSRKGWKPLSMEPAILVLITLLTLLIAGAVEVLAHLSQSRGGLALSRTQDEIPQYAMISYLYVPNIVAVLYSLIWSWVDLDVKRMQPWFELSKPEGATAENSMFLDYPYDFIATVPVKAARRRHWPVFFAGTVTVVIFWLITPLQSSIMGTGFVNKTEPAIISTRSSLVPLANQPALLNNEILNTGFAVEWLGQSFPSFTTPDYAILPFYIDNDPGASQQQLNWTAETTKLWTELECRPANTYWSPTLGRTFDNGQGCNISVVIQFTSNFSMYYIGYYDSPFADWSLSESPECPSSANAEHQFLAIWAATDYPTDAEVNVTALFCQPSYYKQQVMVTIVTDGYKPQNASVQPISPPETLTEREFNSTSFEFLIAIGMPRETPLLIKRDFPFEQVMQLGPRLDKANLTINFPNMVGYALAGRNEPATPYGDPNTLHEAFNRAHKYLFALAVNQLLSNETDVGNSTAVSSFQQSGIIVSRLYSAIVESLLLLVAIFTISLMWFCHKSTSYLKANPSSISRLVAIFRNGSETNELFRPVDHADEKSLAELFQGDKFRLARNRNKDTQSLYIEKIDDSEQQHSEKRFDKPTGYYAPIRPTALRREMGLLFGVIQIGALIGVFYLKAQNDKENGLIRPSTNFEVLQILENYIPTAFATFSEPFWVLLNRFLCLLQPFKTMSTGRSEPSKSIETTYTALPPQLVIWRALRARHLMLVMICMIALLSNVLAVGLGALFNEDLTTANYTATFTPNVAPLFDNQSVSGLEQYAYIAMSNISTGTSLPPWTTPDYFFQPYTVNSGSESNSSSTYRVSTRGFSVNANCTAVPSSKVAVKFPPKLGDDCIDDGSYFVEIAKKAIRTSETTRPSGLSSIEYNGSRNTSCGRAITYGWGRTPQGRDMNATVEASFTFCQPYFQTAMFDVRHDSIGNILAYEQMSDISTHLDGDDGDVQTKRMIAQMNDMLGIASYMQWHNDTFTRDWMSYLVVISLNSRDFLDPKKPPPDPNDLLPTIEKLYRQLFVIVLGANLQLFAPGDQTLSLTGQKLTDETRIFVDQNAFIITVTILGLNIIALVIFYSRGVMVNLPRVPTTIGSILAFVSASHILLDDDRESSLSEDIKEAKTYSFGRYIGVDQKVHLGIDMDPHVALVDPASLKEKRSFIYRILPSGLRKRKEIGPVSDSTWL